MSGLMIFWIMTGGLALIVAAVLVLALARGRREGAPPAAYDLQVYRDQLKEIDRDAARGVLAPEDAERVRAEVSRRILAADTAVKAEAQQGSRQSKGTIVAAGLMSVAVLGGGFGLYSILGAPGYGDMTLASRIEAASLARENRPSQTAAEESLGASLPSPQVSERYAQLMEQLRTAVAQRPNDLEGHILLARNEAALGNFRAAYLAQRRVLAIRGEDATAQDYTDYADMLVLAAGGYVSPEAEAALTRALDRDPNHPAARYYSGLMLLQTGRPDVTFRVWDQLLRSSAADDPWVGPIREQMEEVAFRAGITNYTLPQMANLRGPTAEDMDAAQDMAPEDRAAMIRGMVDGLSNRLATQGGTPEEWAQLIGALGVLGETSQAAAIWGNAQEVFAGNDAALSVIRPAAQSAGVIE